MLKQTSAPATAAEALICIPLTCFFSISRFIFFFHRLSKVHCKYKLPAKAYSFSR
jgi:hypothetical protein